MRGAGHIDEILGKHQRISRVGFVVPIVDDEPHIEFGELFTHKAFDLLVQVSPEHDWEGANRPLEPSKRGLIDGPVNQLRDPAVFVDGSQTYLLYSVAGESGIAIAELSS